MRRRQKTKTVAIIALTISVLGLTLGFAAFSNVLTISSSATVTPDASDFKMVLYGVEDITKFSPIAYTPVESKTKSEPELTGSATATPAKINNETLTISDMNVNLIKPGDIATYYFKVINEGKYTAYFTKEEFKEILALRQAKTCTPENGTSQAMVQRACDNIYIDIGAHNMYDNQYFDTSMYYDDSDIPAYFEIPAGDLMTIIYTINYHYVYVDGDFNIDIPDFKLDFTTVEPK